MKFVSRRFGINTPCAQHTRDVDSNSDVSSGPSQTDITTTSHVPPHDDAHDHPRLRGCLALSSCSTTSPSDFSHLRRPGLASSKSASSLHSRSATSTQSDWLPSLGLGSTCEVSSSSRDCEVSGGAMWKIWGCMVVVVCLSCGAVIVVVVEVVRDRDVTRGSIMDVEGEVCYELLKEGAEARIDLQKAAVNCEKHW